MPIAFDVEQPGRGRFRWACARNRSVAAMARIDVVYTVLAPFRR